MNVDEVPESQARAVRCPYCAARRDYPCQSAGAGLARGGRNRTLKRSHKQRRKAWLTRNSEVKGD